MAEKSNMLSTPAEIYPRTSTPNVIVVNVTKSPTKSVGTSHHHTPYTKVTGSFANRQRSPPKSIVNKPKGPFSSSHNYEQLSLIGTGAYGVVYKAKDRMNPDRVVALKKVRIALTEDGVPLSTLREIGLLKQLEQHPNIVRLLDVCHGHQAETRTHLILFLVFELCEQDLASYMEKARQSSTGIPLQTIKRMSHELLSGVDFLHSHRVIHRDLKPQNLLVTSNGTIKLADFGLAKSYDSEMKLTTVVVTLWYRPPEVLLGQAYHSSVDIWSAGAVLFELFSLAPLFPGVSDFDQLDKIFRIIGRPAITEWPDCKLYLENFPAYEKIDLTEICSRLDGKARNLIHKMLSFNHLQRPTALDCLQDEYFDDIKS